MRLYSPSLSEICGDRNTKGKSPHLISFSMILFAYLIFTSPSPSNSAEIRGPEIKLQQNEIYVTTALSLDEKQLKELRNGMAKEFRFYIDVYRVWNIWPDEFIFGKLFIKTLKCDPVKTEYIATSDDGNTIIEKRFKSFESMVHWALNIDNLKLMNTKDLETGVYYVRVTIESKIRKLPPIIGYFMIFLSENEFKIKKNSLFINIGQNK